MPKYVFLVNEGGSSRKTKENMNYEGYGLNFLRSRCVSLDLTKNYEGKTTLHMSPVCPVFCFPGVGGGRSWSL